MKNTKKFNNSPFKFAPHLLTQNKFAIVIYDLEKDTLFDCNTKYLEFINSPYERKDLLDKSIEEAHSKDQADNIYKYLYQVVKKEEMVFLKNIKYKHPTKGEAYCNKAYVPIYIEEKIKYVVHTITDVTKQVEKDHLLHYKDIKFNTLFNNVSDFIIICNHEGKYIRSNVSCAKPPIFSALGFILDDRKDILTFDEEDKIIPPEKLPPIRIAQGEILSGYRISIQLNNTVCYYEINGNPIYDHKGNFIAGILICRDISNRIKNEENIFFKRQYDLLNTTIVNLDLPCIMVSYPSFKIKYLNSKAYADLSIFDIKANSSNTIIGQDFFEVYTYPKKEKSKILGKIQAMIEYRGKYYYHYRNNPNEKDFFFKIMFQPLYKNNNEVSHIAIIPIDITSEMKAQKQLTEALNKQDEVFANISHELKTPLNAIHTANQLICTQIKNSSLKVEEKEEFLKYNNVINQNCYRFTKIINNITDIQNIDSGIFKVELQNKNIVEVLEDIIDSVVEYTRDKDIEIIFDTNTEEKIMACDPVKIQRALLNLISNAIKFSNQKNQICIHLFDQGDFIEILVTDQGMGIEEKYLGSIFDKFQQIDKSFTRDAEGSGVGLPIVKSIIQLHGGTIDVSSTLGQGSTFKILLPVKYVEEEDFVASIYNDKIEQIKIEFSDIYHL